MSVETKQAKIEVIRNETEIGGNTCGRIATALTESNEEKLEKNGSNLTFQDAELLKIKLGIFEDYSDTNSIDLIGPIETTSNSVKINLDVSGVNKVTISGEAYYTYEPSEFSYTPITDDNIKILKIYAQPTEQLFYLAEGEEGEEAQEPDIPVSAFLIKTIIVTADGQLIDPEILSGFKEKAEDNWKKTFFTKGTTFGLTFSDKRQNFYLVENPKVSIGTTTLNKIVFTEESTRSFLFKITNGSNTNVLISSGTTSGLEKAFSNINTPFTLKPNITVFCVYNPDTNLIDILKLSGDGGIAEVVTDSTLQGNGTSGTPLGLSTSKNAEIAGKQDKATTTISGPTSDYKYSVALDENNIPRRFILIDWLESIFFKLGNIVSSWSGSPDNTKIPGEKLVKDSIDAVSASAANKLDKTTGTAQSVTSDVTFGKITANYVYYTSQSSNSSPLKTWTDGTDFYFTTSAGINKKMLSTEAYKAQRITGSSGTPITGTVTLSRKTEHVVTGSIDSNSTFTIALGTPVQDEVNEYILIFKTTGVTSPSITFPSGIVWRGKTPIINNATSWTMVFEQVYNGSSFEVKGTAIPEA